VRVIRHGDSFLLYLVRQEKNLLFDLLKLYPQIPVGHFPLSKGGRVPEPEANQRLLEEALAEQRKANKSQLQAFLSDPKRCEPTEPGFRLRLSEAELEWLLQMLNDIRIGSWIRLGSPEEGQEMTRLEPRTMPFFWAMELAGDIQIVLVRALARGKT
jgi:hypothetical protein